MFHRDVGKFHKGKMAYLSGQAAEQSVERQYLDRGYALLGRRWRGTSGEIDLVFGLNAGFVFVEVKKSRSFDQAALRISRAQRLRIFATATEFVARQPNGQLSQMRFDVALCNAVGEIRLLENALYCD